MARAMKDSGIPWIGEIPEGWTVSRLKYIADLDPKCDTSSLQEDSIITYTPMEYIKNGYYISNTAEYGSLASSLTQYEENDIVMAKVTPCFENGNIAVMAGLASGFGLESSELFALRVKKIHISYLFYWLQNESFKEMAKSTMTGTGGLKRVSPDFVRNCPIHFPPMDEQQRIASFLDSECSRIDAIIEKTRASIEEYKKLKQAVITEAVTKGIRPGRKMKDSGIEWIGEIPEEWRILSLGAVTRDMRNGYVGPTKDLFREEGIPYIQSLHIKNGTIEFDKHKYYVSKEWADIHPKIKTDDILIVQTGDIGSVGLVEDTYNNCNCHALIIATPNLDIVFPKYLLFYLMSTVGKELLLYYKTGALLPHLNSGKIKFASICVPPKEEQVIIANHLNSRCAEIDSIVYQKEQVLFELELYKKSIIYEYVTGKKEVF